MNSDQVTTFAHCGVVYFIRNDKHGDIDVIREIVEHDFYHLHGLKESGFRPKVILDVGAHIGSFSSLAHQLWPEAAVYAIEPHEDSFSLLCLNAPFATCLNAAVRYDEADILTDGQGATGAGFMTTRADFSSAAAQKQAVDGFTYSIVQEGVRLVTLEEALELFGVDRVDLAKFDCEGSEMDCFRNLLPETSRKIRNVVGEYHAEGGFSAFKFLAEQAFPHLEFYGGNDHEIGPFFSRERSDQSSAHSRPAATASEDSQVFSHSGDFGDLIYALPTIKAMGGGQLRLTASASTRQRMTAKLAEVIIPLLERQSYIRGVTFWDGTQLSAEPDLDPGDRIYYDLDVFRGYWRSNCRFAQTLASYHLCAFNQPATGADDAWLEVDEPIKIPEYPVIVHRSPRYQNPRFPWQRVVDKYEGRIAFIGMPLEHEAFCQQFGVIPHLPTATLLDVAKIIAGSDLFVGNQSGPYAIAEGLKASTVQEVYVPDPNCLFPRLNAVYVWDATVALPDL